MGADRRTVTLGLAAAGVVLAVYVALLYAMPKHVFWSPDEGGRYIELHTLQWRGGLSYELPYPGRRLDPEGRFFPDAWVYPALNSDGSIRMPWPIWFPLLSKLSFTAFGIIGIYIVPLLFGVLTAVASGVLIHMTGSRLAPLAILLVGLASPVCFYSLTFWEHTLATFVALLATVVTIYDGSRPRALFVAAPLVLVACLMRLEMFAFLGALITAVSICNIRAPLAATTADPMSAIWLALSPFWRRWLPLAGVAVIIVLALIFMLTLPPHRIVFLREPFFGTGALMRWLRMPNGLIELVINSSETEGPQVHRVWARLTFGAVCLVALAAYEGRRHIEAACVFPALAVILGFSGWLALTSQSYRALHGIVPVAPYVVVAVYLLPHAWRTRQRPQLLLSLLTTLYLLFGVAAILIFYLRGSGLATTLEWGQRYVLTLYPLLSILALLAVGGYWQSSRSIAQRVLFVLFFGAMVGVAVQQQVRGLKMLHENRELLTAWDRALRDRGVLVTDVWWLPAAVAELYTQSDMFVIEKRAALADWIEEARRRGVRRFTFASLGPPFDADSWPPSVRRARVSDVRGLHLASIRLAREGPPRARPLDPPAE